VSGTCGNSIGNDHVALSLANSTTIDPRLLQASNNQNGQTNPTPAAFQPVGAGWISNSWYNRPSAHDFVFCIYRDTVGNPNFTVDPRHLQVPDDPTRQAAPTPVATQATSGTTPQAGQHPCNVCPRAFNRKSDLRRHFKRHFSSQAVFDCNVTGCDRNGGNGFYRRDKLADHLKQRHGL
jgi:uncharacterized Zn-finger protein